MLIQFVSTTLAIYLGIMMAVGTMELHERHLERQRQKRYDKYKNSPPVPPRNRGVSR